MTESSTNDGNKINVIYECKGDGRLERIFGAKFVENNKNNIELRINGMESELVKEYKLKADKNNEEIIIIKNKITNFKEMFYGCKALKCIEGLMNLDVKEIQDFSYMFRECSSLSDLKPIQNWNVCNGTDFSLMFRGCSSLSDLKPIQNWNVSNGTNFSEMFRGCSSLSDLKPIQNWNVSKDLLKKIK